MINLSGAGATIFAVNRIALLGGLTLVRLRGEMAIGQTLCTTIGDGFDSVGVGFCIVSENAAAVGATAVPHPIADMGWDGWLFHHLWAGFFCYNTTEEGQSEMDASRQVIDSKAMRKWTETDVLVGMIELGVETGAATLKFSANTRILAKLP